MATDDSVNRVDEEDCRESLDHHCCGGVIPLVSRFVPPTRRELNWEDCVVGPSRGAADCIGIKGKREEERSWSVTSLKHVYERMYTHS